MPETEENIFDKLSPFLKKTETYKDMKRFRNVIVHRYTEINNSMVFNNIRGHIDDFKGKWKKWRKIKFIWTL